MKSITLEPLMNTRQRLQGIQKYQDTIQKKTITFVPVVSLQSLSAVVMLKLNQEFGLMKWILNPAFVFVASNQLLKLCNRPRRIVPGERKRG